MPAAATRRPIRKSPRQSDSGSAKQAPRQYSKSALFALILAVSGVVGLFVWLQQGSGRASVVNVEVVNEYPHDPDAYCQGLVFDEGNLYEGTGKYGTSSLRRVALETGEVRTKRLLDRRFFGEGIAILDDKIYQLTWRERTAIVYDKQTLNPTGQSFRYQGQGWGLTTDGTSLIMSDGTSVLRFMDPRTFRVTRRLTVHDGRRRVTDLNELEFINGEIFANVWKTDYIVRISPRTGAVLGKLDLTPLRQSLEPLDSEAVLNGIAYDAENDRLFVTGKNWPSLFEIRIAP